LTSGKIPDVYYYWSNIDAFIGATSMHFVVKRDLLNFGSTPCGNYFGDLISKIPNPTLMK